MSYLNKQNVKLLAKDYGYKIYDKKLQVSSRFLSQVEELVEAVIKSQVQKQDNLASTLFETQWASQCLMDAEKEEKKFL